MPTIGIKTSLHEMRHAIISELLGRDVQEIAVTERFNGYTRHRMLRNPSEIKDLFVLIAPYIKRIQQFSWDRFMQEYGPLSDIPKAMPMIKKAKQIGKFDHIVRKIDEILTDNQELIDECVAWFDRNGKGHPETMTRNMFLEHINNHPLNSKNKLNDLYIEIKAMW